MILVSEGPQHRKIKLDSYDWSLSKTRLGFLYLDFGQKRCSIAWPIYVKAPSISIPFMGLNIQRMKVPIYVMPIYVMDDVSIQPIARPKTSLFYLDYIYDSSLTNTPSK